MTKAQERKIEVLKNMAIDTLFHGSDKSKYEFKRFEVKPIDGCDIVSLIIETGLVGDEGTMASIFARDYCQLFIGTKGGVTYYPSHRVGKKMCKRVLKGSILSAVIDQR